MYDMISNFVIAGLAPIISALESLSWIGVSTHFVKLPYLVSITMKIFLFSKFVKTPLLIN